jgi:hypothetical protein
VRVRSDGYGRVVLERIELPGWARSDGPGGLERLDGSASS